MGLGKEFWAELRAELQDLLSASQSLLRDSPLRKMYIKIKGFIIRTTMLIQISI